MKSLVTDKVNKIFKVPTNFGHSFRCSLILITIISLFFIYASIISYGNNNGFLINRVQALEFNNITVDIKGIVQTIDKPEVFNNTIHKGDNITGSYTYNLTSDTSPSDQMTGTYPYSSRPFDISLHLKGFRFGTNPQKVHGGITIVNGKPGKYADEIALISLNNLPLNNSKINQITMYFINSTGNAIDNKSLPTYVPNIKVWPSTVLSINGPNGGYIGASIISTELTKVGVKKSIEGFDHVVDSTVKPFQKEIRYGNGTSIPLAAIQDDKGVTSTFVANQVIYKPKKLADLQPFLGRYGGLVISNNSNIPAPPSGVESRKGLSSLLQSSYTIRVDPSKIPLEFIKDINTNQTARISSNASVRLLGLIAHEKIAGNDVKLNFVLQPQTRLDTTKEQDGQNAMSWREFNSTLSYDLICFGQACFTEHRPSNESPDKYYSSDTYHGMPVTHIEPNKSIVPISNVYKAWRFFSAKDVAHPVKIAIIDGGFPLDNQGHPNLFNGLSDLPANIPQYNFVDNNYFAGGPSVAGGPWHGNGAASVALAKLNNAFGSAGTGGLIAVPMLFKFDGTSDTAAKAVRTAVSWGAKIISMSVGAKCNWWCEETAFGAGEELSEQLDAAHDAGVLVVAAAGNDGQEVNENDVFPCTHGFVLCVGALDDKFNYPFTSFDWSSNYGNKVEIYAPTDIHVEDLTVDGKPNGNLFAFSGTSASAPFVAGVAAMIKSINPNLSGDQIKDILLRTAFVGYGEPIKYINALGAVIEAAGGYRISPFIKITTPLSGSNIGNTGFPYEERFKASVMDPREDDLPDFAIQWSSSTDGPLGSGHTITHSFLPPGATDGPRTITATVTNPSDPTLKSDDSIGVNLRYLHVPPSPEIIEPTENTDVGVETTITVKGLARSTDPASLVGMVPCDKMLWTTTNNANGQHEFQNLRSSPDINNVNSGICDAQMTFHTPGTRTITLSGTNILGDTGSSSIQINVASNPTFAFDLNADFKNYIILWQGHETIHVSVNHLSGSSQPVTLAVSGLPQGIKLDQKCASGLSCVSPPYTKDLILTADNFPNVGNYPITITGTSSSGIVKHTTVTLEVERNLH